MCVIICTVRTVLWYIMSLAGTLLILISLLTQRWVDGRLSAVSLSSPGKLILNEAKNHVFLTFSYFYRKRFRCGIRGNK